MERESPWSGRKWVIGIILASAMAHLWCLGSVFYLDDLPQICENDIVRTGDIQNSGFLKWTVLAYHWQYRVFGISSVGFHAVNWLLHTAVACIFFGLSRELLKGRVGIAGFGALLFAVHPLGSEIPNYARTQDLAWVSLFSVTAAWCAVRLVANRRRGLDWLLLGLCLSGATYAKGPGLIHACMMCAGVVCVMWNVPMKRKVFGIIGLVAAGSILITVAGLWSYLADFSNPRLLGCGLTVSRVFWEFAWRSCLPMGLSADHHIAETLVQVGATGWTVQDTGSLVASGAFLLLALVSVGLTVNRKTEIFGLCLSLYVATILIRVFYLVPEFMPEYRIYPGLPWFCLGAALVLSWLWSKVVGASPVVPAVMILGVCIILSARRSFLWHDVNGLMADVLKQYPTQARAIWELQDQDAAAGKWQAVLDRQRDAWPVLAERFHAENKRLAPARELPTGHFALAEVACAGQAAVALAHLKGVPFANRALMQQERYMKQLGLDPVAHRVHWDYFNYAKARVLEKAGQNDAALAVMREANQNAQKPLYLKHLEKKVREAKRGS